MRLDAITPGRLSKERSYVRRLRRDYVVARQACVYRSRLTTRIGREELAAEAWDRRHLYRRALERLLTFEALPCVKGSHVSPAAKERLVDAGKWRR